MTTAVTPSFLGSRESKSHIMSIDQAFDCTGLAFFFPRIPPQNELSLFISSVIKRLDPRFELALAEMLDAVKAAKGAGGCLEIAPFGRRRLPVGFGAVVENGRAKGLCLHCKIDYPPSGEPEWLQASNIAKKIGAAASWFVRYAETRGDRAAVIGVEGLALRGAINSTSILPCLGLIYGKIWEKLETTKLTKGRALEVPISSWKKAFVGDPRADKKQIKKFCQQLGFGRLETDDESDAVAIALSLAAAATPLGKRTRGRIRPERGRSKAVRKKTSKKGSR